MTKELKLLSSSVLVLKLNGENSQREKERVTNLFRERYKQAGAEMDQAQLKLGLEFTIIRVAQIYLPGWVGGVSQ